MVSVTAKFDLNLFPFYRIQGLDRPQLPGLVATPPPKRTARRARPDRLLIYLTPLGKYRVLRHGIQPDHLADGAALLPKSRLTDRRDPRHGGKPQPAAGGAKFAHHRQGPIHHRTPDPGRATRGPAHPGPMRTDPYLSFERGGNPAHPRPTSIRARPGLQPDHASVPLPGRAGKRQPAGPEQPTALYLGSCPAYGTRPVGRDPAPQTGNHHHR